MGKTSVERVARIVGSAVEEWIRATGAVDAVAPEVARALPDWVQPEWVQPGGVQPERAVRPAAARDGLGRAAGGAVDRRGVLGGALQVAG